MDRPNVLLVVLDTARADALEPYGAAAGTTPALAQLAARGRAFPHVHSTACWTMPSHVSMFTGALPREVGLSRAPGESPTGCRPRLESLGHRFLPEVLRADGYRTRGVSCNLWLSNASGFATGFEDFRDIASPRAGEMVSSELGPRARWALDALRARVDDGAAQAGRVLRDWFAEPGSGPTFWFTNLIECHSPYLPPKPWNDLGPLDRIRAGEEARQHLTMIAIWRACVSDFDVPPEALERMRHLYDRSIRQLDAWVADVLTALDDAGKLEDTLVLVCSDHGENFGEGGLLGHAYSLDQRLLHVPLIASGPNLPADVRSLTEVPRVIADAIGLDEHPWPSEAPEIAVAQFDPPGADDDARKVKAVEEWGAGPEALERLSTHMDAAVRGDTKLLRRGDQLELYNLGEDPLEERPRVVSRADAPADLLGAIDQQPSEPAAPVPTDSAAPTASPEELARIEEQMRTLGYL
jgi:arylsulfatase A-like enzyme